VCRRTGAHVVSSSFPIPRKILSHHGDITLCIDLMYVNRLPFFVTISWKLQFATIDLVANCLTDTLSLSLTAML
jgi:hypothetical protein